MLASPPTPKASSDKRGRTRIPLAERMALWALSGWAPHAGQMGFISSDARFRIFAAGARTGKSAAAAAEVEATAILVPRSNQWIVAPTYELTTYVWDHLLDLIDALPARYRERIVKRITNAGGRGSSYIEFANGSWIATKSADNPRSLLGVECDRIVVDEGANVPDVVWHRYLRARLSSRLGRLDVPSTPAGEGGWLRSLFDEAQLQQEAATPPPWHETIGAWQAPTWTNPYWPFEEWETIRATTPPEIFAEQFEGQFVGLAGKIYKYFSRESHVVPAPPAGWDTWPRWRSIDFGYTNPASCGWYTRDPSTGTWYRLGEVYGSGLSYESLARLIREHPLSWPSGRIVATIADSADPGGKSALRALGVPIMDETTRINSVGLSEGKASLDKAVHAGIRTVMMHLHAGRLMFVDGQAWQQRPETLVGYTDKIAAYAATAEAGYAEANVREHMFRAGLGNDAILKEIASYVWKTTKEGDYTMEVPAPHQADHALDELRYLLHTVEPLSPPRITPTIAPARAGGRSGSRILAGIPRPGDWSSRKRR